MQNDLLSLFVGQYRRVLVNLGASLPLGARGAPAFTLGVGGKAEKSKLQDGTTP